MARPQAGSCIRELASLWRGDGSLHAEVALLSLLPCQLPGGHLLGFGPWAHRLQGRKEMLPKTFPWHLLSGCRCSVHAAGAFIK